MTITSQERAYATGGRPDACHVTVLTDRCAGCQECLVRCPAGALSLDPAAWVVSADDSACVGCRQCERTCPFSAIVVAGPALVAPQAPRLTRHPEPLTGNSAETRAGITGWEQALAEAGRCLRCPDPTCVRGCPAHNDIPAMIGAIADRDLARAHEVLSATTMLPDACSRVCDQSAQCEGACTWALAGGTPVAIGALERFACDQMPVPAPSWPDGPAGAGGSGQELSVAVIGAGPAGAAAAWDLRAAGASVTIYERDERPGGLLRWGIPDFTLPDAVASRPFDQLAAAGVDIRCGAEVSPGDIGELLARHDAVVLAVGASAPLRLPVTGGDLAGITDATSFLKRAKAALDGADVAGLFPEIAGAHGGTPRVLVIGGGNTAMDVARSALRLGMAATCVEWLDRRFAPVRADELAEAEAEGADVRFLTTLVGLDGEEGQVRRATLARTRQGDAASRPAILAGQRETREVDLVVMALGYRVEPEFAPLLPGTPAGRVASGLPDRRWLASGIMSPRPGPARRGGQDGHGSQAAPDVGRLALGREQGVAAAALPFGDGLFAAGDVLVGPSTVVEAMAQGRRAARAILADPPRRPGRDGDRPMRVLVCYESRTGTTARAARAVGAALEGRGARVTVAPLREVGPADLHAADLVVVGSWVEGLVLARVRPARRTRAWLAALPRLTGKRAAVFCTYAVSPRGGLAEMTSALRAAGAQVLAEAAISRHAVEREALSFGTDRLAAFCWPDVDRTS